MTGEFRTAKGWRIFMYIISPLFIGLFFYVGFIAISSETSNLVFFIFLTVVSLGGLAIFIYGLIETIKGRLIIKANSISRLSAFGTRTLDFQEIKGYRTDSNYIHLISSSENKKSIRITAYIEKHDQVLGWLSDNFRELDSFEAIEEENQILANSEFGINEQTREYRLNEARRASKYLNIIGVVIGAWVWFYPRPYSISVLSAMILPIIALCLVFIYGGLIRIDEKKNSAYPSIIYGILAPSGALLIRSLMDFEILEYQSLWIVVLIATAFLTCLLILSTREFKFTKIVDYVTALTIAGIVLCYTFGTYVVSNCFFDKTQPEIFSSEVIDKTISSGKSKTYYLTLKPWGPRNIIERVSVTKTEYETTDKGEIIDIYLRPGLLKTPWFYVVTE